jgi:hypothetical protein
MAVLRTHTSMHKALLKLLKVALDREAILDFCIVATMRVLKDNLKGLKI